MPINLTPAHLRCSLGGCPSVTRLDDGRLLIVGVKASANPETHLLGKLGNVFVGADEEAMVISPDLLADLPEILHLRSQLATLKQALEPMHQYAAELMMAHEAIMAAWRDKASPEIIIQIETLREKLFAVSKVARAALTEEDKEKCDSRPVEAQQAGEGTPSAIVDGQGD